MTVAAEPVPSPNGARCAASFSFDVDAESAMLGVSTAYADRMSAISHQDYGPLTGVRPAHSPRGTVYVSADDYRTNTVARAGSSSGANAFRVSVATPLS